MLITFVTFEYLRSSVHQSIFNMLHCLWCIFVNGIKDENIQKLAACVFFTESHKFAEIHVESMSLPCKYQILGELIFAIAHFDFFFCFAGNNFCRL